MLKGAEVYFISLPVCWVGLDGFGTTLTGSLDEREETSLPSCSGDDEGNLLDKKKASKWRQM